MQYHNGSNTLVVCLKWGSKYSAEYVNRLYRGVRRFAAPSVRFVCITEDDRGIDSGVEIVPLPDVGLSGWWNKLLLFRKDFLGQAGTALFLDLDVVIVRGVMDFFAFAPGEFCIAQDPKDRYNSSVFRFELNALTHVWDNFQCDQAAIVRRLHGDQDWIVEQVKDAKLWPRSWVSSYKYDCASRIRPSLDKVGAWLRMTPLHRLWKPSVPPTEARVVMFHGQPKPADVAYKPWGRWRAAPWVKDYWV